MIALDKRRMEKRFIALPSSFIFYEINLCSSTISIRLTLFICWSNVGVNLVEVNFPVKIKIVLSLLRREKNLNRDQCDLLLSFGQMSSAQAIANSSVMFQSS